MSRFTGDLFRAPTFPRKPSENSQPRASPMRRVRAKVSAQSRRRVFFGNTASPPRVNPLWPGLNPPKLFEGPCGPRRSTSPEPSIASVGGLLTGTADSIIGRGISCVVVADASPFRSRTDAASMQRLFSLLAKSASCSAVMFSISANSPSGPLSRARRQDAHHLERWAGASSAVSSRSQR